MSVPLWPSRAVPRACSGSLRAERRTLRQGLVALVLSTVAGFIAGLTLSGIGDTLQALPGLIILIPAAVGMRGTIFGAIGARLGTTNAAGTFEVSFRRDGVLYQNVYVAVVTTFASSLWLAVLAEDRGLRVRRAVDLDLEPRHDLGGRRRARLGLHPARDGRACRSCPTGAAGTWTRCRRRWSRRSATWSRSRRSTSRRSWCATTPWTRSSSGLCVVVARLRRRPGVLGERCPSCGAWCWR